MTLLYNLSIKLYLALIWLVSPVNPKARLWLRGRKNVLRKMQEEMNTDKPVAWFHASSLGEFEQGRPVIETIRNEKPEYKILLTFFSPSGYEIRKNYSGADYIYYLPLDTKKNATRFLQIVQPKLAVFIKYEFWFHYLTLLKEFKSGSEPQVILISAIFRSNQAFFKWYGKWYRQLLKSFDHLFVQDEKSVKLLSEISVSNVTKSGDTRFDRVAQIASHSKQIPVAETFSSGKFTFVCGSTWEKDEEILTRYINRTGTDCRFILAPHEINTARIRSLQQKINKKTMLFSEGDAGKQEENQVLIIDNIGMLSSIYKYGQAAYIGGGFGAGIHNVLEAAVFGMPVVFGPNHQKFREAVELHDAGAAFSISGYDELEGLFNDFQTNTDFLTKISGLAEAYISENLGATKKIIKYLQK